jgi:hypothetical protein
MTAENPEEPGRVPVSDLRALVEEWEDEIETTREANRKWSGEKKYIHYRDGKATAMGHTKEDLEELVAEYE